MRKRLALVMVALAAVAVVQAVGQSSPDRMTFEAAKKVESVDGDLTVAIEMYRKVSEGADRALAAKALLRMADCYQKLGNEEFRRIYEHVVARFGDQPEAAEARTRLIAVRAEPSGPASGLICSDCVGPLLHPFTISPDGRWVGYTVPRSGLKVRNVASGEVKHLANNPANYAVWSPDSHRVVYFGRTESGQLHVVANTPGSQPRSLVNNPDITYVFPKAWTPDDRILVEIKRTDSTWQLAWVSANSGKIDVLRSLHWQFNEFQNGPDLSPDGRYVVYSTFLANQTSSPLSNDAGAKQIHILAADGTQDVVVPTNVYGFPSPVWTSDGKRILFLSDRDGSGSHDLWQVAVRDGKPVGLPSLLRSSIGSRVVLLGMRSDSLYYVLPESSAHRVVVSDLQSAGGTSSTRVRPGFAGSLPAWSPDGSRIAWMRVEGEKRVRLEGERPVLVLHQLETGRDTSYVLPEGLVLTGPHWTSNGSAVLVGMTSVETRGGGFAVIRVDLATSGVRQVGTYVPSGENRHWDQASLVFSSDGRTVFIREATMTDPGAVVRTADCVRPFLEFCGTDRTIVAIELSTGQTTLVLPGVTGVERVVESVVALTGQAREVRPGTAWFLGVVPGGDGKKVALNRMKNGNAFLGTMNIDGTDYREIYGPVAGRPSGGIVASRLSDPKWLRGGLGLGFGVQQDDLSWKLMRVTEDGRSVPFDPSAPTKEFTLEPGTLKFDISPDGKRVAYERLMAFGSELWALDLSALLKKPQ